jgi:hypothetical protein
MLRCALAAAVAVCLLPSPAGAQGLKLEAPSDRAGLAKIPALSEAGLAHYQEPDETTRLDTLFRVGIAAGRWADAEHTLAALHARVAAAGDPQGRATDVQYQILVRLPSLTAGAASAQGGPPWAAPPSAVELAASALDVGGLHIVLQSTSLRQVEAQLGGSIQQQGDAGVAVRSLCYYQLQGRPQSQRRSHAPWILWLTSSELYHGDVIHGFRLARLAPGAQPEAGCIPLRQPGEAVLAGAALGQARDEVVAALGPPVTETPGTLLFLRAGLTVIEDTLFTVQSRVCIRLESGHVDSIEVSKSTSIS